MVTDIIFDSHYFFISLDVYSTGNINRIEPESSNFFVRIPLPERISIS
jgi:hypothetical protein